MRREGEGVVPKLCLFAKGLFSREVVPDLLPVFAVKWFSAECCCFGWIFCIRDDFSPTVWVLNFSFCTPKQYFGFSFLSVSPESNRIHFPSMTGAEGILIYIGSVGLASVAQSREHNLENIITDISRTFCIAEKSRLQDDGSIRRPIVVCCGRRPTVCIPRRKR